MRTGLHRVFAATTSVALVSTLVFVVSAVSRESTTAATRTAAIPARPNIVAIDVDDMRADEISYLKKTLALLPGTTFTNSYVSTSLCCPSRAAFLTGQYSQNNHIADNNSYSLFDHQNTLAKWLHDSGYFTSLIGKYLNGYDCTRPTPPGWSHWQGLCAGIYNQFGFTINDNHTLIKYSKTNKADYQTDVVGARAAATIREGVASGQPFFIWVTPTAPHGGPAPQVAPRYLTALKKWKLTKGPAYNEADVSDKPAWIRAIPKMRPKDNSVILLNEVKRLRMLLAVDDMVATIVNQINASNVAGNTIVMFTSDNGYMLGEHRVPQGKGEVYAESLRVPLIISGPGIPVADDPAPVSNTDLAPTIAELAGIAPEAGLQFDGQSMIPTLADPTVFAGRVLRHYQILDVGGAIQHPAADAVQADQFLYDELPTGERELYDHRVDPNELNNVAADPSYQAVVGQLSGILHAMTSCAGAACDLTRPDLPPSGPLTATCSSANLTCTFTVAASDIDGSVASIAWSYGDGTSGTAASAPHTYAHGGAYAVSVTVTDDRGVATTTSTRVHPGVPNTAPVPAFSATPSSLSVAFDATASQDVDGNIVSYAWDFGDGATASGTTPTHVYVSGGSYSVTLTVTDDDGAVAATTRLVTVTPPNQPPTAAFTFSVSGFVASLDGSASSDPDGHIVQYLWDFGDGSNNVNPDGTSERVGVAPVHTYVASGNYVVVLTVTDDGGLQASTSQVVTIT